MIKGIDISAVQGVRPVKEWETLAALGIKFALGRAVVGNDRWDDLAVASNAIRAAQAGIVTRPYVFAYPLPHLSPDEQAEHFAARLEAMGLLGSGAVACDLEWPPREEYKVIDGVKTLTYPWKKWGCTDIQIREWCARHLDRLEQLVGKVLVYSYRYWLHCIGAEKLPELATRDLWLADYRWSGRWPTVEECERIVAPRPWKEIAIVQHDGNGGLRLPSGVDADFNVLLGDEARMAQVLGIGSAPEPLAEPVVVDPGVRLATDALIVDDAIAEYRRERIDAIFTAA